MTATVAQWQALFRAFESNRLPQPVVALEANSPRLRTIAVAYSDYLGLSNRQILHQEMGVYPLAELPAKEFTHFTPHSIVHLKSAHLSPAALRLIAILKTQAKEMPAGGRVARMI